VFKHKGERYKLIWKERLGFAKMAIRHKCPIVPFSSLGADECYDIILDSKEILNSPIGILLKKLSIRPDAIPPIVSGIGRTPIPKPQRLYFAFGEPVDTSIYGGDHENLEACKTVKEIAAKRIEEGIEKLKALREKDAKSSLKVRAARSILGPQAKRVLPLLRRLFEWEENSLEKLERLLE
jgi:1-acyl-sn-glycerol-3-phosphate acyltransferase